MSALLSAASRLNRVIESFWRRRQRGIRLASLQTDTDVVNELVHFVRTPEWSVSMLEDIAALVHTVRDVGPDYEPDDPQAWRSH